MVLGNSGGHPSVMRGGRRADTLGMSGWLARPVAMIVLSAGLAGDAAYQAFGPSGGSGCMVGQWVRHIAGMGRRGTSCGTTPWVYVLYEEDDGRIVSSGHGERARDEERAAYDKNPDRRSFVLAIYHSDWVEGVWAQTASVHTRRVEVTDVWTHQPVSERDRLAIVEWFERVATAWKSPGHGAAISGTEREWMWARIAQSAAAGSAGVMLVISGGMNVGSARRRWREGRFGPRACRGCGYSLVGLNGGAMCPECGRTNSDFGPKTSV